jgi:hypothetical protein
MKDFNEFMELDEGRFKDFLQKAQSHVPNPIDYAMVSTDPIVSVNPKKHNKHSRNSTLMPLSKAIGSMGLKSALKKLVQFGSLTTHGATMSIYTGALSVQKDVYRKYER